MSTTITRRGFLALGGTAALAAGLGATLAGCSPAGSSGAGLSGSSLAVLPSTAPTTWNTVLAKFNAGLKKTHGFELNAQFINWTNYAQQSLLKFTAGAKFDTALQALWLNMAQLQQQKALVDLTSHISKWPNLSKQLAPELIASNKWSGRLWGIPQVNSAGRVQHFSIRKDLADKYGFDTIQDFDTLEKYFYDVKQKESGITPFAVSSNQTFELAIGPQGPVGLFDAEGWQNPTQYFNTLFAGSGLYFSFDEAKLAAGTADPVPFWENPQIVDTLRRIRKYYQDGIINANGLNADSATIGAQFQAGKFAGQWAITDGTASNALVALQKAVPNANLEEVLPFGGPLTSQKPLQTFQADNLVVVNANGGDVDRALALQDYLSIPENHDLLAYGVKGTDWEPTGANGIKQLSTYSFPGYALLWRSKLERRSSFMTDSESQVFDWAQDYGNFTRATLASFIPDVTPVKQAAASMNNVITQYANPLYYGVVDVDSQLRQLKSAAASAGLSTLQNEMAKQVSAYLSKK
ncbi:MAG TPA: extracellular solute-binding protein [Microbacterium sp.]|uniref:extracellular solute-binding protein n=1 Tax=Microbacterium sp. TaxID=51671 RepID=UPI002B4A27BD|nr:extracellular solute-binding protein [Microbacterium sp.]HKT57703.1 extracellular solute-binding protein [Microbacterium sp.]